MKERSSESPGLVRHRFSRRDPVPWLLTSMHLRWHDRAVFDDGGDNWGVRDALLGAVIPLPLLVARSAGRTDPLTVLRRIFASFCQMIVFMGIVVVVLWTTDALPDPPLDQPFVAAAILAVAASLFLVLAQVIPPPLDCTTPGALITTYRLRFFVRVALTETPVLFGFVAFMLTNRPDLYLLGAAATIIGFALAAPTTRNLERDQDELSTRGCAIPLIPALRGDPSIWDEPDDPA